MDKLAKRLGRLVADHVTEERTFADILNEMDEAIPIGVADPGYSKDILAADYTELEPADLMAWSKMFADSKGASLDELMELATEDGITWTAAEVSRDIHPSTTVREVIPRDQYNRLMALKANLEQALND